MPLDLPPTPAIWLPPKPAIIRAADDRLLRPEFWPARPVERREALRELIRTRRISRDQARDAFVFFAPPFFAAFAPPQSMSFVTSATSATATIAMPSGAAAGDLCVLLDAARTSGSAPVDAYPSGFSIVGADTGTDGSSNMKIFSSYKALAAADLGTTLTGMTGGQSVNKIVLIFRPSGGRIHAASSYGRVAQGSSGAPSVSLVASANPAPVIALGFASTGTTGAAPSGTLANAGVTVNGATTIITSVYELQNSASADRTFGMNDRGNLNLVHAFAIRFS